MINLLPTPAKKVVRNEYRLRAFSVFLLVTSGVLIFLAVFSLPVSVLLRYQENENGEAMLVEISRERSEAEKELALTKTVIDHLSKDQKTKPYSAIIEEMDRLSGDSIEIREYVFDEKNKLTVNGVADTRSSLADFRSRLESWEIFKAVNLPLSNLKEVSEVPFTVTLTFK